MIKQSAELRRLYRQLYSLHKQIENRDAKIKAMKGRLLTKAEAQSAIRAMDNFFCGDEQDGLSIWLNRRTVKTAKSARAKLDKIR